MATLRGIKTKAGRKTCFTTKTSRRTIRQQNITGHSSSDSCLEKTRPQCQSNSVNQKFYEIFNPQKDGIDMKNHEETLHEHVSNVRFLHQYDKYRSIQNPPARGKKRLHVLQYRDVPK